MEKSKYKNKQGSILIGVIIIFLMISSLSVAIISRSLQGTILTIDSKKGYIAYQNSDKNTENFLNSFKTLDNGTLDPKKIPENSSVLNFCSTGIATCSNAAEETLLPTNTVADIFRFKAVGDQNQGATRAISAPVPDRINGKLVAGDLTVKNCDGTLATCNIGGQPSYNKCDMSVKVPAATFDPLTMKNYEVRKSTSSLLSYGLDADNLYGWQKVLNSAAPGGYFAKGDSFVIQNGDTDNNILTPAATTQNGGQYGQTYYFTIKARNLKPFTLDSLYFADNGNTATSKKVELEQYNTTTSCPALSGPLANCLARGTNPAGTETATTPYNCCNGSECYQPIVGWSEELPAKNCALENIVHNLDDIHLNTESPRGTPTTGYCYTRQDSQSGRDCQYPFRIQAYCTAPPLLSTQELGIVPTNWSLRNNQDVYMSTNRIKYRNPLDVLYPDGKPRCSRHDCPQEHLVVDGAPQHIAYCGSLPDFGSVWDTASTTCAVAAAGTTAPSCGDYTLDKVCALSCSPSPQFQPFGTSTHAYPNGTSCSEQCPAKSGNPLSFPNTRTGSTLGTCVDAVPTIGGRDWSNNSTCQSYTKTATPTVEGYTVTKACSLNCNTNYTVSNANNFPGSGQSPAACCTQDCNANTWTNPGCPTPPSYGYYSNGQSCQTNTCGNVSTAGSCTMLCNTNYHITSSTCTYNYNYNVTCGGSKDVNSSWVNGSTYTQYWTSYLSESQYPQYTWYGYWSSASAYLGSGTCGYTCNSGFHSENGVSCVSNTQVVNCPAIPSGATRTGDASYTQTRTQPYWWYPSYWAWTPVNTSYEGSGTCGYTCGTGNHTEGSACVSNTKTCSAPAHATTSPASLTWYGYWSPSSCSSSFTCGSGYHTNASGTGCDVDAPTCPAENVVAVTNSGTIANVCSNTYTSCPTGFKSPLPGSITCHSGSNADFVSFGASCTPWYCDGCCK